MALQNVYPTAVETRISMDCEKSQEWAQHFGGDSAIAAGTTGQFIFGIVLM